MKLPLIVAVVAIVAVAVFLFLRKRPVSATVSEQFKIVQCDTALTDAPEGRKAVILLAADLKDASAQEAMVQAMIEKFLLQRMISPPDTSLLLVTIVGPCDRATFAKRWRELAAANQAVSVFMARMEKADVGVAATSGAVVPEFETLLQK